MLQENFEDLSNMKINSIKFLIFTKTVKLIRIFNMSNNRDKLIDVRLLLGWANEILKRWGRHETKIQAFGTGLQYCFILHHYHPTKIILKRLFMNPKHPHHYKKNFLVFQETLKNCDLQHIIFDIYKASEGNYRENYTLLSNLYKNIEGNNSEIRPKDLIPMRMTFTPMKAHPKTNQICIDLVDKIKGIVRERAIRDKEKVKKLRNLLDLEEENESESKYLLDEGSTNVQCLLIDDN